MEGGGVCTRQVEFSSKRPAHCTLLTQSSLHKEEGVFLGAYGTFSDLNSCENLRTLFS